MIELVTCNCSGHTPRDRPPTAIDLIADVGYVIGVRATCIAVCIALAPARGIAQPADSGPSQPESNAPPTHRLNLRLGLASSDAVGRPTVCGEVVAFRGTSFESCGTGSGIWHNEVGRQMMHVRFNVPLRRDPLAGGWSSVRVGLGFAELEVGPDRPGFDFGEADQPNSSSGPDAAASVQWLKPLGSGIELVATGTVGVAWIQGAPDLRVPQSEGQPYAAFEIGAGW